MKFSVEKEQILEALQKVQSVVSSRTALPILSHVLLEAQDGQLKLSTTDMEVSVQTTIPVAISELGNTTLPVRRFFSICRELPSHEVNISVSSKNVAEITSGASFFKLEGLAWNDFPAIPSFSESVAYTLEQATLRDILQKTSYAASVDESRAILNGSLLSFREGKLTVVSTDGRRLALAEQELDISEETAIDVVVPTKTVGELIKTLNDVGSVTIKISETQIAFEFDQILIISKLVDGTYPNYRQVIPSQCEERIAIDREMFLAAVRRVSLMLDDQTASVALNISENRIELKTSSPEIGEASEGVPVKYSGKAIHIAFNPAYLMAPLKHLDSDEIYLELSDELSPGVIKCNVPFLYVIMPIRV